MDDNTYNALAMARKYVWSAIQRAKRRELIVAIEGDLTRIERAHHIVVEIEADLAKLDTVIDAEDRAMRERGKEFRVNEGDDAITPPA